MSVDAQTLKTIAQSLPQIVKEAGDLILEIYNTDFETRTKAEGSPVTEADEKGEELILGKLKEIAPEIAIIAEESFEKGIIPNPIPDTFFLVDPLDGTKEFVSKRGEYTVNIALVINKIPVLGAVHLPAKQETYWVDEHGKALFEDAEGNVSEISARAPSEEGLVVVASRSHRDAATDDLLSTLKVKELLSSGSSLKLCRIAEGDADLYPRTGRTMEWDIAAGDAVLRAAGGEVLLIDGTTFEYGKEGCDNSAFLAKGMGSFASFGLDYKWAPKPEWEIRVK